MLKPAPYPQVLYPNKVNANPSILSFYTRAIIPRITKQATLTLAALKRANGIVGEDEYEDDGNYGSSAAIDVEVLQAISKRVHYGTSSAAPQVGRDSERPASLQANLSPSPSSSTTPRRSSPTSSSRTARPSRR